MRKALVRRLLDELAAKAKPGAAEGEGESAPKTESYDKLVGAVRRGAEGRPLRGRRQPAKLLELARFRSTHGQGWTSLADYVARMKEGQEAIFYISGESHTALRTSPQLEQALAKGVEVLLLDDPVDEFWLQEVKDFQNHDLRSLTRGEVDLSDDQGRGRAGQDRGGAGRRRAQAADRPAQGLAGRRRHRRARLQAAEGQRRLPGRRGPRHGPAARALPQAAQPARQALQARARDQRPARADPAHGGDGDGRGRRHRSSTSWPGCCSTRPASSRASRSPTPARSRGGCRASWRRASPL